MFSITLYLSLSLSHEAEDQGISTGFRGERGGSCEIEMVDEVTNDE